jgi:transcriptional regulator with XRE-family HTH domain
MVRLRVKEISKQKGISMGKLSRASDISYRTIQRIYNDPTYIPTIPTLEKIARVLGVPTGDLLEDVPDDTSTT